MRDHQRPWLAGYVVLAGRAAARLARRPVAHRRAGLNTRKASPPIGLSRRSSTKARVIRPLELVLVEAGRVDVAAAPVTGHRRHRRFRVRLETGVRRVRGGDDAGQGTQTRLALAGRLAARLVDGHAHGGPPFGWHRRGPRPAMVVKTQRFHPQYSTNVLIMHSVTPVVTGVPARIDGGFRG